MRRADPLQHVPRALILPLTKSAGSGLALGLAASLARHAGDTVALVDLDSPAAGASCSGTPSFAQPMPSITYVRAAGLGTDRLQELTTVLESTHRHLLIWAPGFDGRAQPGADGIAEFLSRTEHRVAIVAHQEFRPADLPQFRPADLPHQPRPSPVELLVLGAPEPRSPAVAERIEQETGCRVAGLLPALPQAVGDPEGAVEWFGSQEENPFAQALGRFARRLAGKRVGLALGMGAGRGHAHIWVLQALERMGIRPDVIAGSSIGAIVAALYGSGVRYGEIEQHLQAFGRQPLWWSLPIYSLIAGAALDRALLRPLSPTTVQIRIEDFPLPCAFVAVDVATGEEVVLQRGSAWRSARASASMPAILPPMRLDGRLLIDGGVINPVPCRVARELGADVILGVSLEAPHAGDRRRSARRRKERCGRSPTWPRVLFRSWDLLQRGLTRECLHRADIPIRVVTPSTSLRDFRGGQQYREAAERAVEEAHDRLSAHLPWIRPPSAFDKPI